MTALLLQEELMRTQKLIGTYAVAFVAAAIGVGALAQSTQPASGTSTTQSVDSLFLQAATAGNAFEVETSRLALQKSNNNAIKAFAQRMIDDHTKAQQSVNNLLNQLQRGNNTGATGGGSVPTTGGSNNNGSNTATGSSTGSSTGSTSTGGNSSGTSSTNATSSTGSTTGSSGTNTTGTGTNSSGGTGNTSSNATGTGTGGGTPTTSSGNSTATQGNQGNPANFNQSTAGTATLNASLTADQQIKVLALSRLSGAQFNTVYVREQINAHEATIQLFRYAASYATNAQVKAYATQTLPTLQKHYAEALRLPRQ
jgi:predicted outer membrane protein